MNCASDAIHLVPTTEASQSIMCLCSQYSDHPKKGCNRGSATEDDTISYALF